MQVPLQITWRDVPKSEFVESDIRKRAAKLEAQYEQILSFKVVVEQSQKRHHKGNLYHISLHIQVPEKEIAVTRDPSEHHAHEDMNVAVRDAFDAARRQLVDYVDIRRGHVKHHDSG